jgi:hypothetical protein
MTGDIVVNIAPGTYYTPNTINFTTADSGTNGYNIMYKNSGVVDSAKFVGGMKVSSSWTQVQASTDSANPDSDMQQNLVGQVYKTNLRTQLNTIFPNGLPPTSGPLPNNANGRFSVNTLYVNDNMATQARTLNSNKYPGMPATLFDNPLYSAGGNYDNMTFKGSDASNVFKAQLVNAQTRGDLSAQIVCNDIGSGKAWDSNTLPVVSINTSSNVLTFNPNDVGDFTPLYGIGGGSRYYLQGNLAYLDTPGEFYFNPVTYDLYYYPTDAEKVDLSTQDIAVPTTEEMINLTGGRTGVGDATNITPVHNITFDGLKFADTSFPDYYSSGYPWLPYASGTPSKWAFPDYAKNSTNPIYCGTSERPQFQVGTVTLEYTDNITISNCHIKNSGMNGIELYLGVTNTDINNCLIEYCGNGGVQIEGGFPGVDGNSQAVSYTNHNTVQNCVVHDVGKFVHQTFGIVVANSTYNTVTHCEIYNTPRRALLVVGDDVQGWNNTASGSRNWNPTPFVLSRDEYCHHNSFSYLYMHDAQQDGGDDGALFTVFLYYPGDNYSQPNWLNQIVIDKVWAEPTMTDIAPNNINFDMGWVGIQCSNIKTVNAGHYNIENGNLQNGQVGVNNCSFNFRGPEDGLAAFDNPKMDYANIGVQTSRYPAEYAGAITNTAITPPSDIYFSDNFENGLDLTKWSYSGVLPTISKEYMSESPFNGNAALDLNDDGTTKSILYRNFSNNLNKTVTVDFFDRASTSLPQYSVGHKLYLTTNTFARVDNGTDAGIVAMGVDTSVNGSLYVVNVGGAKTATTLRRTTGWHTLKFDYTDSTSVKMYIDNNLVKTISGTGQCFNYVALGSPNGNTHSFFDQLYIFGGAAAPAPNPLPIPISVPGSIEAESYTAMSGVQTETCSEGGQDVTSIDTNDWMEYYVQAASSGAYSIDYRVAVNAGITGGVNLLVDGIPQKTTTLPSTGGNQNWATVSDTLTLSAGTHTIRLQATAGGWNLNKIQLNYLGHVLPGRIEAETYDAMSGVQTETCSEGSQDVCFIDTNDWMDYNVYLPTAGTYTINYRVSETTGKTGGVDFRVDGVSQKTTSFPSTGGWQNWTTVSDTVSLSAGVHTIRLMVTSGGWNINWFELVAASTPATNTIQAESYSSMQGIQTESGGTGTVVGYFDQNDWMCYNNIDFGTGVSQLSASVSVDPSYAGKQFELRLDSTTGTLIGTFTISNTGGWNNYTTQTCSISNATGVHNLYIVAKGSTANNWVGNIDWFKFVH